MQSNDRRIGVPDVVNPAECDSSSAGSVAADGAGGVDIFPVTKK